MTFKTPVILAIVGTFGLTACMEPGPDGKPTNTQSGAVAGALIGGFLGASGKGDDKLAKAATGAMIGGAIGGLIGNQLDKQKAELQRDMGDPRVQIVNLGDRLVVTMPEGILFATDSAAVQPSIQDELYTVADSLNRYPNSRVEVIGHTDTTGSAAYNMDLSQRRALAVSAVLRNAGVSPVRLVAYGRGEDQPVASNLTPEGRAQNRRVEIVIIPNR